ncbi:hypothetical protein BSPA111_40860 [Buttiauxella sp. A111]|nr:hypothetical protein BSPA111_40860 [Buttiauxella sp. A111]
MVNISQWNIDKRYLNKLEKLIAVNVPRTADRAINSFRLSFPVEKRISGFILSLA